MKRNIIKSSLLAAVLLSSSAFAGLIVTDTDMGFTPNKQYGFGGWNLDNVNVKITQEPYYNSNVGSFNALDGTYSAMGYGYSFESEIRGEDGSTTGKLHGKDWPVGEPAGVKIINGDTGVSNGKPENCIMTTCYLCNCIRILEAPIPNICSGPFQSHKRFKIDMQESVYQGDNAYGKAIDMVFNLQAGDSSIQAYQVFQKINNYTGKRLDGYSIELLDVNRMPNSALTLSLGTDIWGIEGLANWSHGLWGPATAYFPGFDDHHFPESGFFDDKRVYYPAGLSGGNTVISYVGPIQGGNYQAMFGNWLPSKWHPMGIFFDSDNNPNTDADLLAFWGDPLHTGTNGWHKGIKDDWATPTEEEIAVWTTPGGLYEIKGIEDTVNLGLNYIVNIGDNAAIGSTFTLRIRPHFAPSSQQGTPSYVNDAPEPNHPGSERGDPDDGKGSVPAYDKMSLLVMIFGFLGIGAFIARRKLV